MLTIIPQVLPRDEALALGRAIAAADWVDGSVTSGPAAARVKRNRQLPEDGEAARTARQRVQQALSASAVPVGGAAQGDLPAAVQPLWPRRAVWRSRRQRAADRSRHWRAAAHRPSATLFLSEDYDGGELAIAGDFGRMAYKLAAGDMVLYPATSLHRVNEVTRGERLCAFFWVESLVRDGAAREVLFDLDQTIQALNARQSARGRGGGDPQALRLTKVYHNLVRRWAG
jgi:PKHD-type hydroxylase